MSLQRINGFVMAHDQVHGSNIAKIRITEPGHPENRKKARIASTHEGCAPKKGETVSFVLGSTVVGGRTLLVAHDVIPTTASEPRQRQEQSADEDHMDWFIIQQSDGHTYAACFNYNSMEELQAEIDEDEKVLAYIPFDIREHITEWDDQGAEDAFSIIAALARTTPTLVALEKLVTAIMNVAVKQVRSV